MTIDTIGNDAASRAGAAGAGASAGAAGGTDSAAGVEDRFLKLLVAQMRNQDPLNPLDNAEVTSQLAQINTVRGIEELNRSMRTMAAAATDVSPLSAVGLLGRQVLVEGDSFTWSGSAPQSGADPLPPSIDSGASASLRVGFELPATADAVRLELTDAAGRVVMTREFAAMPAGVHTVEWNGSDDGGKNLPGGEFRLQARAVDSAGAELPVATLVPARVQGVSQATGGARVDLSDGSAVTVPAIRAVL